MNKDDIKNLYEKGFQDGEATAIGMANYIFHEEAIKIKKETAKKILQELFDYFKKDVDTLWIKVVELAKEYGIELEDEQ